MTIKHTSGYDALRRNIDLAAKFHFASKYDETLLEMAERAATVIYAKGLCFENGKLMPGEDCNFAYFAGEAFRGEKLEELKKDPSEQAALFASIIEARLDYTDLTDEKGFDCEEAFAILRKIHETVKASDWQPAQEPEVIETQKRRNQRPGFKR